MHKHSHIVKVSPVSPENKIIEQAGKIVTQKGVIIFPAQYLYGIAVDALDPEAIKKVFSLKKRPLQNPLLVLIKNRQKIDALVSSIPDTAEKLIEKFWPGNVTIIFNAAKQVPDLITAGTGKIGLRMPLHPVAKALVDTVDCPITGTSANISGTPATNTIDTIDPYIIQNADMILDAGKLKTGLGSTVVDITQNPVKIIRQGQTPQSDITRAIQNKT